MTLNYRVMVERNEFSKGLVSGTCRSEMTLNYRVMVERNEFSKGLVGGSSPTMKLSLYLTGKKIKIENLGW
jgi:hypothetical protein